ncbi:MAG: hypothetical protein ACJAQ3_004482, partial [Planctomycetota bacterium]
MDASEGEPPPSSTAPWEEYRHRRKEGQLAA